jgi:hypothetical protein
MSKEHQFMRIWSCYHRRKHDKNQEYAPLTIKIFISHEPMLET